MPRASRREHLLDAAIVVIRERGAHAMTLDAVAAEAGVSKGGVLYHFKGKRALIDGLIARWLDDIEEQLDQDNMAAAYVKASDLNLVAPDVGASEFGVLAALIEEPHVLEVARERYAGWTDRMLEQSTDPTDAWLVRLASDGLWYSDLLGIATPQGEARERLTERLLALAEGRSR